MSVCNHIATAGASRTLRAVVDLETLEPDGPPRTIQMLAEEQREFVAECQKCGEMVEIDLPPDAPGGSSHDA